jgi:sulfate transporter 4
VNKKDCLVWMAAFLGTMFAGVEIGLAISIGLAVLLVVIESAFPHTAVLGRIPGTTVYRNLKQYPNAEAFPGILLYRVDAPLYFANVNYIRDQLRGYILHNPANVSDDEPAIEYVILEMSPMSHIDATGLSALSEIIEELEEQGIQLALANPSASVIRKLELDNIPERLGREWIFVRMHDAIQFCRVSPRACFTAAAT